ncbi:hypothetical protein S83_056809 [Arachis hypogaea]
MQFQCSNLSSSNKVAVKKRSINDRSQISGFSSSTPLSLLFLPTNRRFMFLKMIPQSPLTPISSPFPTNSD